jgi:thiol-disulfide isomerase/thioredoxin
MGKAPPLKPPGAKKDSGLSANVIKIGTWVLGAAVVIGVSHLLSPSPEEDSPITSKKASTAVRQLDDTNFDSFLAEHPGGALVNFHSQSCKFCAQLAPEYEKAATQLKASGGPPLVSLDSAAAPEQMKRFSIDRYPTVYWFWQGENVLELQRAPEKSAEKIAEWASWAFTSAAVQELDARADFDEALPMMRNTVHSQHRLIVAFNHTGFEGLRSALEPIAQRNKANTVFLFIKEVSSDGPVIKAYAQNEADDTELTSATPETLRTWVQGVVEEARIKRLESQVEEKKAKNEPLEKTLEILQAAKTNAAELGSDADKEDAASA